VRNGDVSQKTIKIMHYSRAMIMLSCSKVVQGRFSDLLLRDVSQNHKLKAGNSNFVTIQETYTEYIHLVILGVSRLAD